MQQSPRIATRASFFRGVENPVLVTRALPTINVQDFTRDEFSPFHDTLELALKADSFRAKRNRRSGKELVERIKAHG